MWLFTVPSEIPSSAAVSATDDGGIAVIAWHKGVELNVLIKGGTVDGEKYLAARGLDRV